MKIISFTMLNNESEIIESFIRYNYNFLDKMVIIDNGCTDNTIKIILKLISEGYKIDLYDESLEPYNQFELDNKYVGKIIENDNPDILIPLDADEFIDGDSNPRKILEGLDLDCIYLINWKWFVLNGNEDENEKFIPKRLKYHFKKPAWNSSDGSIVTKVIIPVGYYRKKNLTLKMGHHDVFGSSDIKRKHLSNIRLAHYRAISTLQIIAKTSTYVLRDIATMSNNHETAQRTNQMAEILSGKDFDEIAQDVSRGGYFGEVIKDPLNLKFCNPSSLKIKYDKLAEETLADLLRKTGQEMAIRAYNSERRRKEKFFLSPIVLWMNDVRGKDLVFPNPSNLVTILTLLFNVRGYLTESREIVDLKTNFRLIVNVSQLKFIPHKYLVVPKKEDLRYVRNIIEENKLEENVITLEKYLLKINISLVYCVLLFIPSFIFRIIQYGKRNGFKVMFLKIKERFKKNV